MQLFVYAQSDPLLFSDPMGLVALGPGVKCKGFDRALNKLKKGVMNNCDCKKFFEDEFGANLEELLDSPEPKIYVRSTAGSASTRCDESPPAIELERANCKLGGRRTLPVVVLHELAHIADCKKQRYPPGGGRDEGALAEIACFGKTIDATP